jgi:hypothetical protein
MKIITTREFRNEAKAYFELAEKESIVVKRGKKFVNFVVTDDPDARFFSETWMKDFFAIPEEYRCNPFDISPSGDLYWADKRNVDEIKKRINEPIEGNALTISTSDELKLFFDSLWRLIHLVSTLKQ